MVPISHMFTAGFNIYMTANILSYMVQATLVQNDTFRQLVGLKPSSFQAQYQKELRDMNQAINTRLKSDHKNNRGEFQNIQSRTERRRKTRR